ncbi:MAG: glycosyltransferase family 4 protein [Eubacterium sp.]|nr:glycosyltransferase family 4 protein [Eubacterium sp.]
MEEATKVLWISTNPPVNNSPHAGGQTFNYYFKGLSKDSSIDVKLIALCWDGQRKRAIEDNPNLDAEFISFEYDSTSKKIIDIFSKINPCNKYAGVMSKYYANKLLKKCKELKDNNYEPEVVILEWTDVVLLAKEIKNIFPNAKLIASEHDVMFVGYERKRDYYKNPWWGIRFKNEKKYEIEALNLCNLIMVHNKNNEKVLISNGVDGNKISHLTPYYHNMSKLKRNSNYKDILFFGAMNRKENYLSAEWFIDNVMPLLNNREVRFIVLGSSPDNSIKNRESERIIVTGFVDSIDSYFEESMCFVAPLLLGAGIKVKVMEALSSGIPVLTNEIGIEGIPAKNKKEYFHCKKPDEYKTMIENIIDGKIDETEISGNAKNMMDKSFSPEKSLYEYKERIKRMVIQ